jgi:hypothetical protein
MSRWFFSFLLGLGTLAAPLARSQDGSPSAAATNAAAPGYRGKWTLDLTREKLGEPPRGWRSALAGQGRPGQWQVIEDEATPDFVPLTPEAPQTARRRVIAQVAKDPTDERFPLLILDDQVFGDFVLSVRFKTVSGVLEQMAGVVFRVQDERNFYVVRASSLGGNVRFYRVANGVRDAPLGPEIAVPRGQWHELSVTARGNRFTVAFNGRQILPELTDNSFAEGKIGLWTKSDAVSYFSDLRIEYRPRLTLAKELVAEAMKRYERLLAVKIFATTSARSDLHCGDLRRQGRRSQCGRFPDSRSQRRSRGCLARGDETLCGPDGREYRGPGASRAAPDRAAGDLAEGAGGVGPVFVRSRRVRRQVRRSHDRHPEAGRQVAHGSTARTDRLKRRAAVRKKFPRPRPCEGGIPVQRRAR